MRILVYSCIREVDRIGVRERRESCAARPREEGKHVVSKIKRAVSVKIVIQSIRGVELMRRKVFDFTLSKRAA